MKQLLYLTPLLFMLGLTTAASPSYVVHSCSDTVTSTAANISYHSKLNSSYLPFPPTQTRTRFFTSSTSEPASGQTIQGLYQSRGDVSLETCNNCESFATTDLLQRCPNNNFVRAVLSDKATQAATPESSFVAGETSTQGNFSDVNQIYSLVQCTEDLSAGNCRSCLHQAIMLLPK